MKKLHLIFRFFLSIEVVAIIITLILSDSCGSACSPYSLLNPFGHREVDVFQMMCTDNCVWRPHDFFYIFFHIFLLTIFLYIVGWIIGKKFMYKLKE